MASKLTCSALSKFQGLFGRRSSVVIGMIHVEALPGTPRNRLSMADIIDKACGEARLYKKAGVDGIIVENMHDIPYLNRKVGPEITAAMSVIANEVKREVKNLPCGIQILAGANKDALAVAKAAGLEFIRAEGFVFAHVADEGIMNSDAGELLRYRKEIGADEVLVFCDIKKKHRGMCIFDRDVSLKGIIDAGSTNTSHSLTADIDVVGMAKAAEFFLADGVVLTGSETGSPASIKELQVIKESLKIPILIGSGVDYSNVEQFISANALIVGSYFKEDGNWMKPVNFEKVKNFMSKVERLRK